MHSFKDKEGREWRLSINFHSLAACRDEGVDLTQPTVIAGIGDDPYQLGIALWCLVSQQANERNVSPESFAEACSDGETVDAALNALVAELVGFTRPAKRRVFEKALAAKAQLDNQAIDATEAMIDSGEMQKELAGKMDTFRREMFSSLATNSPESSE